MELYKAYKLPEKKREPNTCIDCVRVCAYISDQSKQYTIGGMKKKPEANPLAQYRRASRTIHSLLYCCFASVIVLVFWLRENIGILLHAKRKRAEKVNMIEETTSQR